MAHLIDKNALVAEIERLIDKGKYHEEYYCAYRDGNNSALYSLKEIINTLKVKEVDLDEEIQRQYNVHKNTDNSIVKDCVIMTKDGFEYFAKHFFELGLCSTITKEDCKLIWNIGDDLPYMPEEDFFKELLRRYKSQKGEDV